jgi:hypothetical protein
MPLDAGYTTVVDMTNVKDSSGINPVHQEPGDYKGIIKDVSNGKATSGQMNEFIMFLVADADRPSATYPYRCTLTEKSLWKLRNILVAAGKNLPKKKFKLTAAVLNSIVGSEIGMSLEDNEYEGKVNSQIVGVFPASDLPDEEEEPPAKKKANAKKKPKEEEEDDTDDDDDEDLDELDIDDL